ncbi:hypothetical protein pb186bvf_011197 [Paramecium bursaria]
MIYILYILFQYYFQLITSLYHISIQLLVDKLTHKTKVIDQQTYFVLEFDKKNDTFPEYMIKVKSDYIVQFDRMIKDGNKNIYLFRYIKGLLLSEVIKQQKPKKDQIYKILVQLIEAIYQIHKQGIEAFSISVENILITELNNIILLEYGCYMQTNQDQVTPRCRRGNQMRNFDGTDGSNPIVDSLRPVLKKSSMRMPKGQSGMVEPLDPKARSQSKPKLLYKNNFWQNLKLPQRCHHLGGLCQRRNDKTTRPAERLVTIQLYQKKNICSLTGLINKQINQDQSIVIAPEYTRQNNSKFNQKQYIQSDAFLIGYIMYCIINQTAPFSYTWQQRKLYDQEIQSYIQQQKSIQIDQQTTDIESTLLQILNRMLVFNINYRFGIDQLLELQLFDQIKNIKEIRDFYMDLSSNSHEIQSEVIYILPQNQDKVTLQMSQDKLSTLLKQKDIVELIYFINTSDVQLSQIYSQNPQLLIDVHQKLVSQIDNISNQQRLAIVKVRNAIFKQNK